MVVGGTGTRRRPHTQTPPIDHQATEWIGSCRRPRPRRRHWDVPLHAPSEASARVLDVDPAALELCEQANHVLELLGMQLAGMDPEHAPARLGEYREREPEEVHPEGRCSVD